MVELCVRDDWRGAEIRGWPKFSGGRKKSETHFEIKDERFFPAVEPGEDRAATAMHHRIILSTKVS